MKDFAFASCFLILSALAAGTTNAGLWNSPRADPRIPGLVAALALLLRPLVVPLLPIDSIYTDTTKTVVPESVSPVLVDVVLVSVSVAWSFFLWQKQENDR